MGGWYQLGAFTTMRRWVVVAQASRILELRLEPRTTQSFESLVEEATFWKDESFLYAYDFILLLVLQIDAVKVTFMLGTSSAVAVACAPDSLTA